MSKDWIRRIIALSILVFGAIGTIGCETTKGAGRDVQKAGDTITDTASDVEHSVD